MAALQRRLLLCRLCSVPDVLRGERGPADPVFDLRAQRHRGLGGPHRPAVAPQQFDRCQQGLHLVSS